jgi:hypothetical protein
MKHTLIKLSLALLTLNAASVMAECDIDKIHNGLTLEQFQGLASSQFKEHDLNNDGVLKLDEVQTFTENRFKELDTNNDKKLDRSEMRNGFKDMKARHKRP